jgi:hypothetical protein
VDLGFLNPQMRPALFQLLTQLGGASRFSLWIPDTLDGDNPLDDRPAVPGLAYRPRITIEGLVVLARRRWVVPSELLPQRTARETIDGYFLRVNVWRHIHALPDVAYARLVARTPRRPAPTPSAGDVASAAPWTAGMDDGGGESLGDEADAATMPGAVATREAERGTRVTRPIGDLRKPQFVDFTSPLLTNLLGRIVEGRAPFDLVLEEALPAADELLEAQGDGYVTELILQVDVTAERQT